MKIGIPLGMLNPRAWVEVAEAADRLGFESVWLPEHLVIPTRVEGSPFAGEEHPPIPSDIPVYDAFTYLAYLAGRTERVRLGTHVYNIGLRHPFTTARAVTTLDVVSGGRVDLGIGASWLASEWEAVGLDFRTRGRRVDEALTVCRRLWTDSTIEHHGTFFDFDPVMFEPKPVQQPHPPIHVGGDGPAALRRAATLGDGWIPMNHTLAQVPAAVRRLAELREEAGREGNVEVTLGGAVERPGDLDRYTEAGVDRVLVRPWRSSKEAVDGLHRFADDVFA
ncbi:MAG: LLM class F420-dependent oxidoreductase [Actinomycetota bacterium]